MKDYTETSVNVAIATLRAFVRPKFGEILTMKADSHPSHPGRAREVTEYFAEASMKWALSAPYYHNGVGECEATFMHDVPAANGLLRGCPEGGGLKHMFSALLMAEFTGNELVSPRDKEPRSAAMLFESRSTVDLRTIYCYGAPGKTLVTIEARDSKFDDHAVSCIYRGPSRENESANYCWVSKNDNSYTTVHIGGLRLDERPVIARSTRSHPSHQSYSDPTVEDKRVTRSPLMVTRRCGGSHLLTRSLVLTLTLNPRLAPRLCLTCSCGRHHVRRLASSGSVHGCGAGTATAAARC